MTTERRRRLWGGGEEGSTLLLMPAAVLVLVVLAGIAVDAATVFLGQQRLSHVAAGLANDAIAAVDEAAFYERGEIEVVQARVEQRRDVVLAGLAEDSSLHEVACEVTAGIEVATVACAGRAEPIFGRALPGTPGFYDLFAVETARAAQD